MHVKTKIGATLLFVIILASLSLNSTVAGMCCEKITIDYVKIVAIVNMVIIMPMLLYGAILIAAN